MDKLKEKVQNSKVGKMIDKIIPKSKMYYKASSRVIPALVKAPVVKKQFMNDQVSKMNKHLNNLYKPNSKIKQFGIGWGGEKKLPTNVKIK